MVKKEHMIAILLVAVVIGAVTYPQWSPIVNQWLTPIFPPIDQGGGGQVTLMVALQDGNDDSAVSPTNIAVAFYEWPYGPTMPTGNVDPLVSIGAGTESPDGEFSTSATATEGTYVYVYITDSGNTYQTTGAIRYVPFVLHQGISREAVLDPIVVWPRSATSADDIAPLITSGGAEVDNSSNWAFGENDYRFEFAVSSGKSWGTGPYIEPSTGYYYNGGFIVFAYDISTARVTHEGGPLYRGPYDIGTTRYYIYWVPQIVNDADMSGDGTWFMDFTIDVTVGDTSNALNIDFYPSRRVDLIDSLSFGTSDHDDLVDGLGAIGLATS